MHGGYFTEGNVHAVAQLVAGFLTVELPVRSQGSRFRNFGA